MYCRFCYSKLNHLLLSLGSSPLANAYLSNDQLQKMEPFYPLEVYVCEQCYLVQLQEYKEPENIFSDYAYFSSYSDTWLRHAKAYVEKMTTHFEIDRQSYVIEVASNDGYLLQHFCEKGIPVLGIEPAANVAQVANQKGIPTQSIFFGKKEATNLVHKGYRADLLLGNNVLAHVPDLNDFVAGFKIILKPTGFITMEFPYLLRLLEHVQFDTIYHEHFSYFSLSTVENIFLAHGLSIFDVEQLSTHGGSLRIYACHREDTTKSIAKRVSELKKIEIEKGFQSLDPYLNFSEKVKAIKREILKFLIEAKEKGKTIIAYGAPAKGNTLLNYCGIGTDFIDYTVDRNPHKQGRYLPGSRIPIESPDKIKETKPDYVFILPWNLEKEIIDQMAFISKWGGQFVLPIPTVRVL